MSDNELPIKSRIEQLRVDGKNNKEIVNILYQEGYDTKSIMVQGLSLRQLDTKTKVDDKDDESFQSVIAGPPGREMGYLAEFKKQVRHQISRSRQLTAVFYDLGLTILLASLSKSGLTIEEFRKIYSNEASLSEALNNAAQTSFKALEYFEADAMVKLERERDEARAYASALEAEVDKIYINLDPKIRLEKMIYNMVLMSGSTDIDPNILSTLIDRWLEMEVSTAIAKIPV